MPSQQKLNLCPLPLIKLNYLEGMKKKRHWDGSGSLLLVPIPSPAPTEWEFVAVRLVWFRSRLEEPMPCTPGLKPPAAPSAEPWLLPELIKEGSRA